MLSEIENGVLNSAGLQVNSTVSSVISGILDGKPFLFVLDEEVNQLTLMLEGNEKYYIIIDLETGLVLDVVDENGTIYKGATSSNSAYCFHGPLTDSVSKFVDNFIKSLMDPHTAVGTAGSLLITAGLLAAGPLGWGVLAGLAIGGAGVVACAYGSHLLEDEGYKDYRNWLDFGLSVSLGVVGGWGASMARPVITSVSKEMIAVSSKPIKGSLNPARISFLMKFGKYNVMTEKQYIFRGTLGDTSKDKITKFVKEYGESSGMSTVTDMLPT